ncbi:uncharacterized protein EI90DRAFT_1935470 [Cantharellus anzutake]|uniref:uncharacterized protein n=1 Tax=Cantharellus anzutake TaxID=1750568 RepID=UPI001902D68C|nr:uncharacterized protein EI90DRAFT_1935470 [Cantharellus anzutake]KAF8326304.1 hypothetical protein EI90DRAFT_1935470 [Cantharellus anzutake]
MSSHPEVTRAATQSPWRTKNASLRNAKDVSEIDWYSDDTGDPSTGENRRIRALVGERDRALQELREQRDDLERSVESLRASFRKHQANAEKNSEIWNLECALQELREKLNKANSSTQRAEAENKRTLKQLVSAQETINSQRDETEQLQSFLDNMKSKHEVDIAQMRKALASHQREKSDLETALDVLKSELAKKSVSLPNRFGSTNGEAGLQEPLDVKSKREIDITQPIPALLNEYDKASQGTKEEKGDLGLGFESVHNAENLRLEQGLQEIREKPNNANAPTHRAQAENKHALKQLSTFRESIDAQKGGIERLQGSLDDIKRKHESDVAQMREIVASLEREKNDLQTALDNLKSDSAQKSRPRRTCFGSPVTRRDAAGTRGNEEIFTRGDSPRWRYAASNLRSSTDDVAHKILGGRGVVSGVEDDSDFHRVGEDCKRNWVKDPRACCEIARSNCKPGILVPVRV